MNSYITEIEAKAGFKSGTIGRLKEGAMPGASFDPRRHARVNFEWPIRAPLGWELFGNLRARRNQDAGCFLLFFIFRLPLKVTGVNRSDCGGASCYELFGDFVSLNFGSILRLADSQPGLKTAQCEVLPNWVRFRDAFFRCGMFFARGT